MNKEWNKEFYGSKTGGIDSTETIIEDDNGLIDDYEVIIGHEVP